MKYLFNKFSIDYLGEYRYTDFATRLKVSFIFHFSFWLIVSMVLIIFTTSYIHTISAPYYSFYWPIILPEIGLLCVFTAGIFFLVKGYFQVTSHLLIITSFACAWFVIWQDKGDSITRLDTLVIIVGLLNTTPFFVQKRIWVVLMYGAVNILSLVVFMFLIQSQLQLTKPTFIDVIVDTSIALIFSAIMGYKMVTIHKKSLDRANSEIGERIKAEAELKKYQEKLELIVKERTEELQATNEELQITNEELNDQKEELNVTLTRLKETQTQLIQTEKMASLGILTAGVAHEINNPLNFIMGGYHGLCDYFEERGEINNQEVQMMLHNIITGINRTSAIINGLNQFSRHNDKKDEDCDIPRIIENCLLMLQYQFKGRITVKNLIAHETIKIKGNVGKLHQVFLNILSNAAGAIEKEGEITIAAQKENNSLKIIISDTGIGISEENLKRVLDPFFTTKDPGKGTGLGLSVTYSILKDHNGDISISSIEGLGTTVTISLPVSASGIV
jgi:signal transduction histidine kinase